MNGSELYEVLRARWFYLHDHYQGGWRYDRPSSALANQAITRYAPDETGVVLTTVVNRARSYLVPFPGEDQTEYTRRAQLAVYINFPSTIVDAYVDAIVPSVARDLGSLTALTKNLDGQGMAWADWVDDVARWAGVYGWVATVIDAPRASTATNRAEEDARGVGLRGITVHPPAIVWCEVDEDGAVTDFAYSESVFLTSFVASHKAVVWRWTRDGWEKLAGAVDSTKPVSAQRGAFQVLDSGTHGTPGRVPVTFAFFKRDTTVAQPVGISLIDDAAKAAQCVFNMLSGIESFHRRTTPFLAIPSADAGGALPPQTEQKVGPDSAMGFPSQAGSPQWVTPPSETNVDARTHAMFLIAAAYRFAGLEVQADTSAQVQSGEALRVRSRGFESRAKKFAQSLERWERDTLGLCAQWTRASDEVVLVYPGRYVLPDLSEELARCVVLVTEFGGKLGAEGQREVLSQALRAALTLSDERLREVLDEAAEKMAAGSGAAEVFSYDYDSGIITVDEARARKGEAPHPDSNVGSMSVLRFRVLEQSIAEAQAQRMGGNAPAQK